MRPGPKRYGIMAALILAALAAFRTITVGADTIQWKNLGPGGGGNMLSVGVSPADANIALMGSDVGGIYRTANGGQTWSLRNNALVNPARFTGYGFYGHFEFDPVNTNRVYYGHQKSADAGLTWNIKVDESDLTGGGSRVDATQPDTVYSFGYANVYRSTDAWESSSCLGIARPPEPDGGCAAGYACTVCGTPSATCQPGSKCYQQSCLPPAGSGLTSEDACVSYNDIIRSVVINKFNSSDLLACSDTGLYRSTNAGRNWAQITPGIAAGSPEPLPSGVCYGGTSPGDACSINTDCAGSGAVCRSVECVNLIQHDESNVLFMVVKTHPAVEGSPAYSGQWIDVNKWQGGVYKSLDWGVTWTSLNGVQDIVEWLPNTHFDVPGGDQAHPVYGWVAAATTPGAVVRDTSQWADPNAAVGSSVRIEYTSDDGSESSSLATEDFVPVTAGQEYELSAWHKTLSAEGLYIYAKFWWYKADQTPLLWPGLPWSSTEGWVGSSASPVTFDWRRYKERVRIPTNAAYVKISFSAGYGSPGNTETGSTWVDEVSFHKVYDLPEISGQGSAPYFVSYNDIAVDPVDANIIYTGALRSSVLDIPFQADFSGIWKTTDGGLHWSLTTRQQWRDNVSDNGAAACGDNVCGGGWEDCNTCPNDCTGADKPGPPACCGDNLCTGAETAGNCQVDCPLDPDPLRVPPYEARYFYDANRYYNPDPASNNFYYPHAGGNTPYYLWAIGIGRSEPQGSTLLGRNTLYAGAYERLRTTDAGATWSEVSSLSYAGSDSQAGSLQAKGDATDVYVGPVATKYDPSTGRARLYYGDTDTFLQVSYNEGKSFTFEGWQWYPQTFGPNTLSPGVIGDAASSIVLDPGNVNRIYVGVNQQFGNLQGGYSPTGSMLGGALQGDYTPGTPPAVGRWQWTPLGNNDPNSANSFPLGSGGVDLVRTTGGDFLASVYGRGVYRKSGNDWLAASSYGANAPQGLLTHRLYQEPVSARLFVGAGDMIRTAPALPGETGVWESSDLGVNWCRVSNHADVPAIQDNMDKEPVVDILATGPNNLLATTVFSHVQDPNGAFTGGGIYRGTRTGSCSWSWSRVFSQYKVTGLARSPVDNSLIYAYAGQYCCSGSLPGAQAGIYKSVDGGLSWSGMANSGLMNLNYGGLIFSSTNPQRLYAPTVGSGLFEGNITCADPVRDFECATRVHASAQQVISGSLVSGALSDLSAPTQDDTYEAFQESGAHRLRVIWTVPGALAGVPYGLRFEGHRTNTAGDTITLSYATRASGTCTGSETYGPVITTVSKFADDDLVQAGNLGVLAAGQTVYCLQLIDSNIGDSATDTVTVDRLYLLPHPADVVAAADDPNGPGTIFSGSYLDTRTSNDVREVLREEVSGNTSLLVHTWRFDNVPSGSMHKLHLEGNRPNNPDGDNFQFYYSTNGTSFNIITGALLNTGLELQGGGDYNIAVGTGGTWYIQVRDTNSQSGKTSLDKVNVDHLSLKTVP